MKQPYQNYMNGEWVAGPHIVPSINPSNLDDVVGEFAYADAALANQAVQAAATVADEWRNSTPQQRFNALDFIGTEILQRKEELGRLLSREEGKTLPEGIGEVNRAGQIFKFFAGEALRCGGEWLPSVRPGVRVQMIRQPVGVTVLISPWNFPIAIPAWKIAPALAYGNTVVFKPAELTPALAWELAEIISRGGLPAGVFNMVMGEGPTVGAALVEHPQVNAVSFTGSIAVGRQIARKCVENGKRVQLEMGGKNPLVVLDDADLDIAVEAAANGAFYSTGQRCTASSRLIVTRGIYSCFVDALTARMKSLKVDDALKPDTDLGPVVNQAQLEKDLKYLEIGKSEGAVMIGGGERLERAAPGYYLSPALFVDTDNRMRINREEIFGPIAAVIPAQDYEEALQIANDTPFGLSAGICTRSLKYAHHFQENSQAGMTMVNLPTAGVDYHVPFGGMKQSSYGSREQGSYAREFYTTVRTCYLRP